MSFRLSDGVAQITLSRPEANNAINDEMVRGLAAAMGELEASAARALLICGDGAHLTVGGDLEQLHSQLDRLDDELAALVPAYHDVLLALSRLDTPVVCAARGVVGGGGLGLLWCADLVFAASDLRIVTGFAGLGLSGDGGSSWWLPRMVGQRRARQLLFGEQLDAKQALSWGLVDRVVPPERLLAEAQAGAAQLAAGPTVAYGHIKRLLTASEDRTFAEQLEAELEAMVDCARTEDAREGVLSFAQRRRPGFEGR